MNNQKPEPYAKGDGAFLDLHSMFFTLQGEGPFSGKRAVFIRLAGCNLQCPGCDTEYTQGRQMLPVGDIATKARILAGAENDVLMVITGGEPFRQEIGLLCEILSTMGHHIQIESNGVLPPSEQVNELVFCGLITLVVSPKTSRINPDTAFLANVFKYVIDATSVDPVDGLPIQALFHKANGHVARPPIGWKGEIYLNPYDAKSDEQNQRNLQTAATSCLKYGYRLGVQLHKLVGLE